jgi:glycine/D-amino acid oxidase-like deaminating enzyme
VKEYPYWWDTLRESPVVSLQSAVESRQSPVALPGRVDVVVVGAGYTGLAAARHLARSGASVVVIEREGVGWGASSRNGGQVLTGLKLDVGALVSHYGESRARALFDAAGASIARLEALIAEESIDCDYERTGHVQAAWKPSHFNAFREEQALLARVFGHRVELVSRKDQRSEIGTDAYHGLVVDERSGGLNPARYVHGLAAAAVRSGAVIVSSVRVSRAEKHSDGWRVLTSAGEILARDVLFATNGYTDHAAPALQRRLVPIGSYIIATEPLGPERAAALLPRRRMAFDSKYFLYYFRVTPDRRLLFGGRAEFARPTPGSAGRAAAILKRGMTSIFPDLESVAVDYAWGGTVAFTRDQIPHAGRLDEMDGAFYSGGYCGHGVAMATHLGELTARRIAGERMDHPLFDDHFRAIPLYGGTPWFLPLVGGYYRVKDWLQ